MYNMYDERSISIKSMCRETEDFMVKVCVHLVH